MSRRSCGRRWFLSRPDSARNDSCHARRGRVAALGIDDSSLHVQRLSTKCDGRPLTYSRRDVWIFTTKLDADSSTEGLRTMSHAADYVLEYRKGIAFTLKNKRAIPARKEPPTLFVAALARNRSSWLKHAVNNSPGVSSHLLHAAKYGFELSGVDWASLSIIFT